MDKSMDLGSFELSDSEDAATPPSPKRRKVTSPWEEFKQSPPSLSSVTDLLRTYTRLPDVHRPLMLKLVISKPQTVEWLKRALVPIGADKWPRWPLDLVDAWLRPLPVVTLSTLNQILPCIHKNSGQRLSIAQSLLRHADPDLFLEEKQGEDHLPEILAWLGSYKDQLTLLEAIVARWSGFMSVEVCGQVLDLFSIETQGAERKLALHRIQPLLDPVDPKLVDLVRPFLSSDVSVRQSYGQYVLDVLLDDSPNHSGLWKLQKERLLLQTPRAIRVNGCFVPLEPHGTGYFGSRPEMKCLGSFQVEGIGMDSVFRLSGEVEWVEPVLGSAAVELMFGELTGSKALVKKWPRDEVDRCSVCQADDRRKLWIWRPCNHISNCGECHVDLDSCPVCHTGGICIPQELLHPRVQTKMGEEQDENELASSQSSSK